MVVNAYALTLRLQSVKTLLEWQSEPMNLPPEVLVFGSQFRIALFART